MITTTTQHLRRLATALALLALSTSAAADWRRTAVDTLVEEAGEHRLVVLGEMHGTREVPLLAGDLVEQWSAAGPVLLALEIPAGEHPALRAVVTGGGADTALAAVRERPWWQVPDAGNDGRRSEDVLALVQRVGRLKASGRDVAVLAFDPRDIRCHERGNCEAAMAHVLRQAHGALPRGRIVVVTGNVHAMRLRPRDAPAAFPEQPMTALLRDLAPFSVNVAAQRGAFWACGDTCGPMPVAPARSGGREGADAPFDYRLLLPAFTPIRQVGDRD